MGLTILAVKVMFLPPICSAMFGAEGLINTIDVRFELNEDYDE